MDFKPYAISEISEFILLPVGIVPGTILSLNPVLVFEQSEHPMQIFCTV